MIASSIHSTIKKRLLSILFIFTVISPFYAQNFIGLWEVKKVTVKNKVMTPIAKWVRINSDKTFQSGNGWLQNAAGMWTYNHKKKTYLSKDSNGIVDESGPFSVSFIKNNMLWERMEEGVKVILILEKINHLPKSTSDKMVGLWELVDYKKEQQSIIKKLPAQDGNYLFFQWSKTYIQKDANGIHSNGYWVVNAHRPEITIMNADSENKFEKWMVHFKQKKLILVGSSDSNKGVEKTYKYLSQFPE